MDTLYLKTSLNAFAPEYDRAVEDVLREKAAGKGVKGEMAFEARGVQASFFCGIIKAAPRLLPMKRGKESAR